MQNLQKHNRAAAEIVLLVDDARDELAMLVDGLEHAGFTALAATHGEAALALLDRVVPHLIVMDAAMPGIDGFEACRRLKSDPRFAALPVVFMTGLTDTSHVLEGLEAGAVDYVTKPVVMAELLARIRVHIANSRIAMGAQFGLDSMGRHLLAIDGDGRVLWATPQAASLGAGDFPGGLKPEFGAELAKLAAAGRPDTTVRLKLGGVEKIAATFLCEAGAGEFLFRLAEINGNSDEAILQKHLALTFREAEVLAWIARGKSNREISEILVISPRTVNKHLERVFAKLGVENRASATGVAMRALVGRR